jgi:hypothetical protein
VVALEIDQPKASLMAAAAMARGHAAAVIAPARMRQRREQTLLGLLFGERREVSDLHKALTRRPGIKLNYCHRALSLFFI